ncbi:hypothetical protein IFM89_024688 [Coptis chinensis]|uniref:Mitochondrial import inner membrane translocase subunit TIM50 n=1 Tax=Coptis chinensis TaxID=261450 RepID=A0A835IED3_9MAGN|nr:hypothetical protein IFM89_024688 [Coptis chinensis]
MRQVLTTKSSDSLRNENFEKELCDQRVFANDGVANTPELVEYHRELDLMTLADGVNMLLQNPDDIVHLLADETNFEIEDTTIEEDLDVNTTDGKVGKQWYTSKSRQWNKFSHLEEAIYTICEDKIHEKFDEIPLVGRNYSIPTVNELPSDRNKCTTPENRSHILWSHYEEDERVRAVASTVIVRRYGHDLELNLRSFSFLKHQGWLNDEVVSIYMELLRRWQLKEGQSRYKTRDSGKYTIIADTLIPLTSSTCHSDEADTFISGKAIIRRPFCDDFLKFCFEMFYVGVWSSRKKLNLVRLAFDFIMPERRYQLAFCWDQSHCTTTKLHTVDNIDKPVMLKELVKLWDKSDPNLPWESREYNESNTVMLDDSPYKALFNSTHTAIFRLHNDFQNENDNSLGHGVILGCIWKD